MIAKKLLVIVPDKLSELVEKGEYTPRYYNPGELFEEVHILMTNDDKVDARDIQKTVGGARLFIHNLPAPKLFFLKTFGYRFRLLDRWAEIGVQLARQLQPDLIRCYGNSLNGFVATRIKQALHIPMVVSMHTQPEEGTRVEGIKWWPDWKKKFVIIMHQAVEKVSLRNADIVLPVYKSILDYVQRYGAKRIKVTYNILNSCLKQKKSYKLHDPVRIISVGRQLVGKNPENIIRATSDLDAKLTIVGDGPLHEYLKGIAKECDAKHKVTFIKAIPNDELCEMLPDFDIFAAHTSYSELPKAVLEPLLTGLPVVLNSCKAHSIPELVEGEGSWLLLVENSKQGYLEALRSLIIDDQFREQLGRQSYIHAKENWTPEAMEKQVVAIYQDLIQK